jgi:ribose transport system substrate-binding protein
MMMGRVKSVAWGVLGVGAALLLSACGNQGESGTTSGGSPGGAGSGGEASGGGGTTYVIGVIAKAEANPVFQAARTGAQDAARELSAEHGVDVQIRWQTPASEDAQKQAEFIELLTSQGVDGIAISCTDAKVLTSAIDAAVSAGVPVCTFDSDAPESKRFAYYGVDDKAAGVQVMTELADQMGGSGVVAVLTGNPNSANLSARVAGVQEEAARHAGITIRGVYSAAETPADMAAKMQQVQTSEPDITGWALVGGWPLYTDNALDGIYQTAKVVSMDPLPLPLKYVQEGQVQVLVGQPYYGWGYESVRMIFEKQHLDESPAAVLNFAQFDIVTTENVEAFSANWAKWLGESGGN